MSIGERVRELRTARSLTREALVDRAFARGLPLSVVTIQRIESPNYQLPTRHRRPKLGLEVIADCLEVDIVDLLRFCSDDEIRASCFAGRIEAARAARRRHSPKLPLRTFVKALPAEADSILGMPGVNSLQNAEAFAVIFELERHYPAMEALVVNEPPLIFLDDCDADSWAAGMDMPAGDVDVFLEIFREYREEFRSALFSGSKQYKVVLHREGLQAFLRDKPRDLAAAQVQDIASALDLPNFQLVLLDSRRPLRELEVISTAPVLKATTEDTLSVVIRQTSMRDARVEYCLVPMPQSPVALRDDLADFEEHWARAVEQYYSRSSFGADSETSVAIDMESRRTLMRILDTLV